MALFTLQSLNIKTNEKRIRTNTQKQFPKANSEENRLVIVSASRSPPGQVTNALNMFMREASTQRLLKLLGSDFASARIHFHDFGIACGITFGRLGGPWDIFWHQFYLLGGILGTLWAHFF